MPKRTIITGAFMTADKFRQIEAWIRARCFESDLKSRNGKLLGTSSIIHNYISSHYADFHRIGFTTISGWSTAIKNGTPIELSPGSLGTINDLMQADSPFADHNVELAKKRFELSHPKEQTVDKTYTDNDLKETYNKRCVTKDVYAYLQIEAAKILGRVNPDLITSVDMHEAFGVSTSVTRSWFLRQEDGTYKNLPPCLMTMNTFKTVQSAIEKAEKEQPPDETSTSTDFGFKFVECGGEMKNTDPESDKNAGIAHLPECFFEPEWWVENIPRKVRHVIQTVLQNSLEIEKSNDIIRSLEEQLANEKKKQKDFCAVFVDWESDGNAKAVVSQGHDREVSEIL